MLVLPIVPRDGAFPLACIEGENQQYTIYMNEVCKENEKEGVLFAIVKYLGQVLRKKVLVFQ